MIVDFEKLRKQYWKDKRIFKFLKIADEYNRSLMPKINTNISLISGYNWPEVNRISDIIEQESIDALNKITKFKVPGPLKSVKMELIHSHRELQSAMKYSKMSASAHMEGNPVLFVTSSYNRHMNEFSRITAELTSVIKKLDEEIRL